MYVLHVFQKSKSGKATPKSDIDLIKSRLKLAKQDRERRTKAKGEVVKTKTGKKHSTITEGSGNVFADMGVPEPEHALAKAKLAAKIAAAIEEEELTQTEAAERLGTDQAKVSAIVRGRLDQFSTERLLQYAQMIGYDVEIRFSRRRQGAGHLRIGT